MKQPAAQTDHEFETDRRPVEAAVTEARANLRYMNDEDMRAWLLKLSQGGLDAPLSGLRNP